MNIFTLFFAGILMMCIAYQFGFTFGFKAGESKLLDELRGLMDEDCN